MKNKRLLHLVGLCAALVSTESGTHAQTLSLLCATNKTVACGLGSGGPALPAYTLLRSFSTKGGDARSPQCALLLASDGALYGTTYDGGSNEVGTVFKVKSDGSGYTVVHHFCNLTNDGRKPLAGLIEGPDGVLFGTTQFRGSNGPGTVFKMNKDGTSYTNLHNFSTVGGDGQQPYGGLKQETNGVLFGTTRVGGTNNGGTVFKVNTNGSGYEVIHRFVADSDGEHPEAGLIQDLNGTLFGTASAGGSSGAGTIFRLDPSGSNFTTLKHFSGADGSQPFAGLLRGSDGMLYGTTERGGSSQRGTVFKLGTDGTGYTVLRHFSFAPDARFPDAGLVEGADGKIYGTSSEGGAGGTTGVGTVFIINKDGSGYAVLRSFQDDGMDGKSPVANLVQGPDGALYGTTENGGIEGAGTVFRFEVPCPWNFDPPTPVNACCGGSNVTITVLSTVTNGVCPQAITRTWRATDCCTNTATCSQTVTLVDARTLAITCPGNITTNIAGTNVAVNYPNPTFTNGTLVGCTPPSGSVFPLGTTLVTCTATNACGSNTCAFNVTVQHIGAPIITQQPQSVTVTLGQTTIFNVTATGDAPLTYQ